MTFSTEGHYFDIKLQLIHNSTKIKILNIAIDLFSRKGYSGVSIRDITKEVGIKESSLYKHFKSKDEILETIFLNFRREVGRMCPPLDRLDRILSTMSPKEFLNRGLSNFMAHINDPTMRKIWRIVYVEQYRDPLAGDIYLNDILGNTLDFLEKTFTKMVSLKQIQPFDPKTLAVEFQYPIFTMITEYIMLRFEDKDTAEVKRKMLNHIEFFCNVISPSK